MSWYRKIDVRLWGDAKFSSLSRPQPNAQTVWLYLLTGPHTTALPGLFHVGEAAIFEALGWDDESLPGSLREGYREAFREAFRELSEKGMLKVDKKARVVWIPNYVKYNPPESPNVIRAWPKQFDLIPECELKSQALQALKEYSESLSEGYREAFREAFREAWPKAMPNQQQQQQQQNTHTHTPPPKPEDESKPEDQDPLKPNLQGRQVSNEERRAKALQADAEADREFPFLPCLDAWNDTTPPEAPARRKTTRAELVALFRRLVAAGVTVEAIVEDLRSTFRDVYEYPSEISKRLMPKAREPTRPAAKVAKTVRQDDSPEALLALMERRQREAQNNGKPTG